MQTSQSSPAPTSNSSAATLSSPDLPEVEVSDGLANSPEAISVLFRERSPLEWTEADFKRAIEHYRKVRKDLQDKPAKKATKAPPMDTSGKSGQDLLSELGI